MPVFNNILAGAAGSGGAAAYEIERSLRFNKDDSSFLEKTFSSAGNRKKWTWSGWVKKSQITDSQAVLFSAYGGSGNAYLALDFKEDQPRFHNWDGSSVVDKVLAAAKLRDPSAWYHIVWAIDTNQSTNADKVKLYINGVRQTVFQTTNYPGTGDSLYINNNIVHEIGRNAGTSQAGFNGYLADVHFVDGQQLAATDFGKFDADTGVWNPIAFTRHNAKHTGDWNNNTTGTGFNSSTEKENAFDGDDSTQAAPGQGGTMSFTPSPAITGISKIRIKARRDAGQATPSNFTLNGTTIGDLWTAGTTATVEITSLGGSPITQLTNLTWKANTNNNEWFGVYQIEIFYDGAYHTLVQGGLNSFYLDFSDNSSTTSGSNAGIGKDVSGNGNYWDTNNITASGTGTVYRTLEISENNTPSVVSRLSNAWDAALISSKINTSTWAITSADWLGTDGFGNAELRWIPAGGYAVSSSLRVYFGVYSNISRRTTLTVTYTDGTTESSSEFSSSINNWMTLFTASNAANKTIQKVELSNPDSTNIQFGGFVIDDQIVTSLNTDTDSFIDSPTNGDATADTGAGGEVLGNYCTWSSSAGTNATLSNGNLDCSLSAGTLSKARATIAVTSGKYYWEVTFKSGNYGMIGISDASLAGSQISYAAGALSYYVQNGGLYGDVGGSFSNTSYGSALSADDVLGVALDMDNGNVKFYKNGSDLGNANTTSLVGKTIMPHLGEAGGATFVTEANFGARSFIYSAPSGYKALCTTNLPDSTIADGSDYFDTKLYTGNASTQTVSGLEFSPDLVWLKARADSDSHGVYDTVRGATKRLQSSATSPEDTQNGVTAFNIDGFDVGNYADTNGSTRPYVAWNWDAGSSTTLISAGSLTSSLYDQSQTWSSTGTVTNADSSYPITNAFDGNLTSFWASSANAVSRYTFASVYSGTKFELRLDVSLAATGFNVNGQSSSSVTGAMGIQWVDVTDAVTASNLGGLSYIEISYVPNQYSTSIYAVRVDGKILVDSSVSVPTVPSVASNVRANPTAGFSIVKWTAATWSGSPESVGHGLNAAPGFIIAKSTDNAASWYCYHKDLGKDIYLSLNNTNGSGSLANSWGTSTPDSSVFGDRLLGWSGGNTVLAYCFAPVEGYSAIGAYVGNGLSNGPFIYTGFKPAFIIIKVNSTTGGWRTYDSTRRTYNVMDNSLHLNTNEDETIYSNDEIDFLSNGFKPRGVGSFHNGNNNGYVYYAVAENPFKIARAR